MEDLVEEAVQETLVEDIAEEIPDRAIIEDVKLPQAYEQPHDVDEKLHQVYFDTNNICVADMSHESLMDNKIQFDEGLPNAYLSPLQCYLDEACTPMCYVIGDLKDDLCLQHKLFYDSHTLMASPVQICNIFDEILSWVMTKHNGRDHIIDKMLEWLHYLYAYT